MSIVRVIHNRENPYVQLNKKSLWDSSLSLKAVGLWARCMSKPNNWKFRISELATKFKEGRRAIDGGIQELIEAGYAMKLDYWEKGANGKFKNREVEYVFFEVKATEEEKSKLEEEFKKSFRRCAFSDLRNSNFQNSKLLKNDTTKYRMDTSKEVSNSSDLKKRERSKDLPPSAGASEISIFLFEKIKSLKPDFSKPNMKKWEKHIDLMIRIDKRNPDKIKKVIEWVSTDPFWSVNILSTEKLRKQFDQLEMKMAQNASKTSQERLKEVHRYIQSHKQKEVLIRAANENRIEINADHIQVKGISDGLGYISFLSDDPKKMIDHWIRKLNI